MSGNLISFCLVAVLSTLVRVSSLHQTYRGAVVEYSPSLADSDKATTALNVKNYIDFMKIAAGKGAQIIVFPEGGLFSKEVSAIPDPVDRIAPCDSPNFQTTETVRSLSAASKNYRIYSVVNLKEKRNCEENDKNCPASKYYTFNTNVVFDRSGTVIARYSKYNLYDELQTDRTIDPELVFFDTDFGVRFGTFTCFDIHFPAPALKLVHQYHITDFVYTSHWFSELPFLTALQMQRGWAESNNVNLLASGVNFVSTGSTGSGIYNGKNGHLVQIFTEKKTSKLLIADIPTFKSSESVFCERETTKCPGAIEHVSNSSHVFAAVSQSDNEESGLNLLKDHLDRYSSQVIEGGTIFDQTVCTAQNFCCDFYVNMDSLLPASQNYTYRAVAFHGVRKFGSTFKGGVQSCGVVVCDGPEIENCTSRVKNIKNLFKFKEIRIKGNFKLANSLQIPSTLTDGEELLPLPANKYMFKKAEKGKNMEVSLDLLWPVLDLHTFAIFGRDFTRDMEPSVPESTASALTSAPILFGAFLAFILLIH